MAPSVSLNERADALERKVSDELDVLISKSALFNMADGDLGAVSAASGNGKYQLMSDDPRLPQMPAKLDRKGSVASKIQTRKLPKRHTMAHRRPSCEQRR